MHHKDEEQLEKLLRQMPKIKDERDPQQIFRNIQPELAKKPRRFNAMPVVALAAALMLLAIVAPMFLQSMEYNSFGGTNYDESAAIRGKMENSNADKSSNDAGEARIQMDADEEVANQDMATDDTGVSPFTALEAEQAQSYVVADVNEDAEYVVTIGVTALEAFSNEGAFTLPISIKVARNSESAYINTFENIRKQVNYEQLGVDVPALNAGAVITEETDASGNPTPVIEVGNMISGLSSTQSLNFERQIEDTFRWKYAQVEFADNGSKDYVEIGNYTYSAPFKLDKNQRRAYFKYSSGTSPLLVPSQDYFTEIREALLAMKARPSQDEGSLIEASVPETMDIEEVRMEDNDTVARIVLSDKSLLENNAETIFALEAMMMTVKEFGMEQVVFESVQTGMIGNIMLNESVKVPYSPNPIAINE
jgi:hypothetical protein